MRINAEDPGARLRALAGHGSTRFRPPLGPGVRVDTFVEEGGVDPAVLRLADREGDRRATTRATHAIERALRALRELEIEGVPTTRDAALEILDSDEFRSGDYSTSFLDEAGASWRRWPRA